MLGFRGCRLGIKYPEITAMQARAVFEAAADATKQGFKAKPEIMIPLVGFKKELDLQVAIVHEVAAAGAGGKEDQDCLLRRHHDRDSARRAHRRRDRPHRRILQLRHQRSHPDLLGMSRDDSGSFLGAYQEAEIVKKNPFASIDQTGVGQLMKIAIEKGKQTRPASSSASAANTAAIPTR